jgi:hypothetical protein
VHAGPLHHADQIRGVGKDNHTAPDHTRSNLHIHIWSDTTTQVTRIQGIKSYQYAHAVHIQRNINVCAESNQGEGVFGSATCNMRINQQSPPAPLAR